MVISITVDDARIKAEVLYIKVSLKTQLGGSVLLSLDPVETFIFRINGNASKVCCWYNNPFT